ncbi:MAG: putative sulfate/molybdate transporter [Vicingaceae bacterium]
MNNFFYFFTYAPRVNYIFLTIFGQKYNLIPKIKFNRQELAGAFGDIGTDLPLIIAMIISTDLNAASVLTVFGAMQIFTGLVYKMPMPVQPLKAMAALIIAQQIESNILFGAGLAIGIIMLLLSISGLLTKLANIIPKAVIRGIQFGLGLKLCNISFTNYIPDMGIEGYIIAAIVFVIILLFIDNKKYPASIFAIIAGIIFALIFNVDASTFTNAFGINFPKIYQPKLDDIVTGFLILALPQIPLSLGNSIIATRQVSIDLFPERKPLSIKKIGLTYGIMNLIIPLFSGIPSCHGSGGMVGHYTFGGRTGGSVIIYGLMYILLGIFFANGFLNVIKIFPLPVLGVMLVFEGLSLLVLSKDLISDKKGFVIALLVGLIAFGVPYGFVISMIVGTIIFYAPIQLASIKNIGEKNSNH